MWDILADLWEILIKPFRTKKTIAAEDIIYCLTDSELASGTDFIELLDSEGGINVNHADRHGNTFLHFAAQHGKYNEACELIRRGAFINVRNNADISPLHNAVMCHNLKIVNLLVTPQSVNLRNDMNGNKVAAADVNEELDGQTILMRAVEFDDPERLQIAQYLIKCGADKNAQNKFGLTALYITVARRNYNGFKLLVDCGADIKIVPQKSAGRTILHYIAESTVSLHDDTADVNLNMARLLVGSGIDVDVQDDSGCTPLITAIIAGQSKIVELLIDCGASLHIKDMHGKAALDYVKWQSTSRSDIEVNKVISKHIKAKK